MRKQLTHIVIPTVNEYENLKDLIPKLPKTSKIVIVDDGSTDGTSELDKEIKDRKIKIIERGKRLGIVSAIIEGIKYAVSDNCDYIATMDADGQHDPEDLNNLLNKAIETKADLVLGSRYIKGGDYSGFNLIRVWISKFANLLFKLSFNFPVKDATSGYRIYSKRFARFLINNPIKNPHYVGQVEIVKIAYEKGFKVEEAPIHFKQRKSGRSKLSIKEIYNYIKYLLEDGPIGKYLVVGGLGIIVNEAVLYLLSKLITYFISDLIAIESSVAFNFLLNENWTFKDRLIKKNKLSILYRFGKHNFSSIAGITINYLTFILLTLLGVNILISNFIGILVAFILRFTLSSMWVWKNENVALRTTFKPL